MKRSKSSDRYRWLKRKNLWFRITVTRFDCPTMIVRTSWRDRDNWNKLCQRLDKGATK